MKEVWINLFLAVVIASILVTVLFMPVNSPLWRVTLVLCLAYLLIRER